MAVQNAYDSDLVIREARVIRPVPLSAAIQAAMTDAQRNSPYQLGAAISYRSTVVSTGFNRRKTHPRSPHQYKWLHAEMDAIIKARRNPIDGLTMYVVRIRKDGTYGNSKPCRECVQAIRDAGLKTVVFCQRDPMYPSVLEWFQWNVRAKS